MLKMLIPDKEGFPLFRCIAVVGIVLNRGLFIDLLFYKFSSTAQKATIIKSLDLRYAELVETPYGPIFYTIILGTALCALYVLTLSVLRTLSLQAEKWPERLRQASIHAENEALEEDKTRLKEQKDEYQKDIDLLKIEKDDRTQEENKINNNLNNKKKRSDTLLAEIKELEDSHERITQDISDSTNKSKKLNEDLNDLASNIMKLTLEKTSIDNKIIGSKEQLNQAKDNLADILNEQTSLNLKNKTIKKNIEQSVDRDKQFIKSIPRSSAAELSQVFNGIDNNILPPSLQNVVKTLNTFFPHQPINGYNSTLEQTQRLVKIVQNTGSPEVINQTKKISEMAKMGLDNNFLPEIDKLTKMAKIEGITNNKFMNTIHTLNSIGKSNN